MCVCGLGGGGKVGKETKSYRDEIKFSIFLSNASFSLQKLFGHANKAGSAWLLLMSLRLRGKC